MRLTFDTMKFPMARVRKVGAFHLWPVTRYQYRQFMEETGQYTEEWYNSLLEQNPETVFEDCNRTNYEGLFMTGVLPEEALAFARWLGEDYDLPTPEEWSAYYRAVNSQILNFRLSPYGYSPEALVLSKTLGTFLRTPLAYSLLDNGVAEWVRSGGSYIGCGAPRDSFFPNMWNPAEDTIKVINSDERIFYFGFRLIKRPHNPVVL